MLPKPSLLINPFRLRKTHTSALPDFPEMYENISDMAFGGMPAPRSMLASLAMQNSPISGAPCFSGAPNFRVAGLGTVDPTIPFCPQSTVIANIPCKEDGSLSLSPSELSEHGVEDLASSGYTVMQVLAVAPSGCCSTKMAKIFRSNGGFSAESCQEVVQTKDVEESTAYIEVWHHELQLNLQLNRLTATAVSSGFSFTLQYSSPFRL